MMNVLGASVSEAFYASHETRDIFLPNQTESVSQVAIDVKKIDMTLTELIINHISYIDWWIISQSDLFYSFSRS